MNISEEEQQYRDFDWFCVDDAGEIGHFTTAGLKLLPPTAARSAEALQMLTEFFEQQPERTSDCVIDPQLENKVSNATSRYLQSFTSMAKRGLYSFDIETYVGADTEYFRVASPVKPLIDTDLPEIIREFLQRTRLTGILFRDAARIPYKTTLSL